MVGISWVFAVLLILLQGNWLAGAQAPTITHQPKSTYAVKSGIAELICEATGTAPLKYKWYHTGVQVQSNERRRVLSNGHLYIKRVVHKKRKGISDTGEYYCTVTDDDRRVTRSRTVNISIGHIRKEFREHPMSQTVSRGGELTLTCISPRGKPKPKLRWLKDDRNVVVDGIRILLEQRSRLVIKNFKKEDEGSYKCEATNVAGRKLSNPAVITSTVPPTITSSPKDKIVDISIYSETTLTCKADGVPTPKIIWKKEGNNTILPSVDGTLTLTKLKPGDIGKYNCIAFNTEGNVSASVHLMLQYVPEFTSISPNVNKMEGSTVKLQCVANGEPDPSIYWRKSDVRDPYRINHWYGNIQTKRVGRTLYLIFKPLKLSDAGNYTCEATNKIGTKTHNVNVGVYRKTEYAPSIVTPQVKISADINSNATIICDVEGNPKPTVKWSKIGQEGGLNGEISKDENIGNKHRYSLVINKVQKSNGGTFQCMASNKIKTITKRIVLHVSRKLHLSQPIIAGVPSMPKNVRVVEYNDKSVRLIWDHSDDPVVVYAVGYIDVDLRSNEEYAAFDVAPNADQYVVQGLKANTRYMFFVRGINKIGRGVPSLLSNVVRTKLAAPTIPPTITSSPKDKIVDISIYSETTLTCKADGVPTPKIIWKKEGNNTILPSVDGTLTLTKLKPGDIGKYNCIAFNTEGNVSASVHLMLQYVPEFTSISPNVNEMEGSTVKLKCVANGEPNPSIYWRKSDSRDPKIINHWYGNIQTKRVGRTLYLIFKPLKLSDAGNYTCEATNKIGTKTHNVNVGVYRKTEYAPSIVTPQVKISADINSNATIICDVEGNPKPTVKWSKIGQEGGLNGEISKDENIGNKHRYSLVINKVQKSNGGTFQCMASNKIKTITKRIVLQVSRKLHLSQPIIAGVPSMPKNVRVVEYNDKSVRLIWDHSDDPVLVYAVGYIDVDLRSNEEYAAFDVAPNADQYVVQGLKANTRYMFFVRGINKIGRGVPSLLSDVVRTKLAAPTSGVLTPPTPPVKKLPKLNITLSPGGAGELRVNWQKLDKSIDIAGYYIYWKVKGSDFQRETLQNDLSTRYTISDLQNSTKYIVRVQVFTEALKGPMSKSMHERTSNKPVSLKMAVTQNDSDSMTVTWKRLWKKNSGKDTLKKYTIWFTSANEEKQGRRRKRNEERKEIVIPASLERYYHVIGDLTPGGSYNIRMSVSTTLGRTYSSPEKSILLPSPFMSEKKSTMEQVKDFIIQPWFLGVLGGVILILILILVLCCACRRSSNKKDVDNLPIELQNTEAVRKTTSEGTSTESDVLTPVSRAARESLSECGAESYDGRSSSVYRFSDSSRTPTCSNLDFPNIAITPNKYERMYRSLEARGNDSVNYGDRQARKYCENDFDSPSRYNHRARNPYSPAPRPSCLSIDNRSDYDNAKPKCESTPEPASTRTPAARSPYPGEAPPDYETAIAENSECNEKKRSKEPRGNYNDSRDSHMSYKHDRYGNLPSRQSSCSPGSECSNQGSSIAGRRKGLKPLPRLTIASVNWADMLPPPPSHPPPASVATRSPPPSPTATSMCSETTYGRSHASSFHPRRSGSAASDFERADSVRSGKSKGKSENKLPFDLAGITSDIIMQWADSVTNTSGSEDESPCSSPDRKSGISSDGSFLTDTDFANAVKAAAECGGFNIDIDLNMYKAMDPISFQPFAGSLSTYNPESNSSIKPPSKKTPSKDGDGLRDSSRGRRARSENSRDGNLPSVKENSTYVSTNTPEIKSNGKSRNVNELPNTSSTGYVPALTRTSALGKLEPVKPVKKKYAVVRKLPQTESTPDYNYPSHSLSSSTSNASTVRSSSCPPDMLSDEDTEDDVI